VPEQGARGAVGGGDGGDARPAVVTRPARGPRTLAAVCAGLGLSALLLWGAAAAFDGAQGSPSLTGVALLALAGVAAVVATGGLLRRVLGGLLGVTGAVVAVLAVRALVATETTAASWLAVAGGGTLLAVGLFVLVREPRLPRLGARYAGPGRPRAELDPDRATWQDLDAGHDPTADAPGDHGNDPGDASRTGAV